MTLYCVCHDDPQADWWGMLGWPALAIFDSRKKAEAYIENYQDEILGYLFIVETRLNEEIKREGYDD